MLRSASAGIAASAISALLVVAPAGAEPKPPETGEPVVVSAAGQGVPASAPDAVKAHVAHLMEGKGRGLEPGIDFVAASTSLRSPQGVRRAQWTGCRTVWAYLGYDHWIGYNLFKYYQQVSWCSNGYSIYSWSRDRWGEVNGPGWYFDGHIDSSLGGPTYRKDAFTQGAFHACVGWFCGQKAPWVSQSVWVDGGSDYETGG